MNNWILSLHILNVGGRIQFYSSPIWPPKATRSNSRLVFSASLMHVCAHSHSKNPTTPDTYLDIGEKGGASIKHKRLTQNSTWNRLLSEGGKRELLFLQSPGKRHPNNFEGRGAGEYTNRRTCAQTMHFQLIWHSTQELSRTKELWK